MIVLAISVTLSPINIPGISMPHYSSQNILKKNHFCSYYYKIMVVIRPIIRYFILAVLVKCAHFMPHAGF
jgi:hypothetical protein